MTVSVIICFILLGLAAIAMIAAAKALYEIEAALDQLIRAAWLMEIDLDRLVGLYKVHNWVSLYEEESENERK